MKQAIGWVLLFVVAWGASERLDVSFMSAWGLMWFGYVVALWAYPKGEV